MNKLTTFSEAHKQTMRRSRKQLFRINCLIINFWNKQTVLRRNFFPWKASKNSSWVKSKKTEEEKIRYKCFLWVYRVCGRIEEEKRETVITARANEISVGLTTQKYDWLMQEALTINCQQSKPLTSWWWLKHCRNVCHVSPKLTL